MRLFGYSSRIAFIAGFGLFQIGEFGFILAQGGLNAGVISEEFYSLILASAILTMLLTPLSIGFASGWYPRIARLLGRGVSPEALDDSSAAEADSSTIAPRVILAGYGRTGRS